ncbi:hypothetical protein N865_00275 [Intrasporangium oryzae NRRL B-24470]|uniref:Uncharacterized protein n=1 Tax=Intrasporangium oryzae NRRL B-24470 TaxID=1386089 RepID=W9G7P4_9MICO|nr:hypothetical protein [Intrasporangium oryzae]EWT02211.1 hypothetical protein N865_00275 [Intrasporangium oryzae NRRL B-24470]
MDVHREARGSAPTGDREAGRAPELRAAAGALEPPRDSPPRRVLRIGAASVLVVVAVLGLTS